MLCPSKGDKMKGDTDKQIYIAALCHMVGGELQPYESEQLVALDDDEATKKAKLWAEPHLSMITERTWLQVIKNGASTYSEECAAL
jgi:hypothetical protein